MDDRNMLWERAFDFVDSGDYYDKDLSSLESKDLLNLEEANKWKDELVKEISSLNQIEFSIKEIELNIL